MALWKLFLFSCLLPPFSCAAVLSHLYFFLCPTWQHKGLAVNPPTYLVKCLHGCYALKYYRCTWWCKRDWKICKVSLNFSLKRLMIFWWIVFLFLSLFILPPSNPSLLFISLFCQRVMIECGIKLQFFNCWLLKFSR